MTETQKQHNNRKHIPYVVGHRGYLFSLFEIEKKTMNQIKIIEQLLANNWF